MPVYPNDPFFGGIAPKQMRRGSAAEVANYVPAMGELVMSTNTNQVFVGNGQIVGGIAITGAANNFDFGPI